MTSIWFDELITAMRAASADGMSASQIAAHLNAAFGLNITRNAVIGKMHRMSGAQLKRKPCVKKPRPEKEEQKPKDRSRTAFLKLHKRSNDMRCETVSAPDGGVTLMELEYTSCRYPFGDPSDESFRFCGAARQSLEPNRAYCSVHSALAYQPVKDQRRWDRQLGIPR